MPHDAFPPPSSARSRPGFLRLVIGSVVGLALAISSHAAAQCGSATGSCLIVHPTPGCDDPECCGFVCSADPLCCSSGWDADCVSIAESGCVGLCGAKASMSCFVEHDTPGCDDAVCCNTVCAIDSFCCDVRWDSACVFSASFNCTPPGDFDCGDADAGDCFEPHGNPACDDKDCCDAVCVLDRSCCDVVWDVLCAGFAKKICIPECVPNCPSGSVGEQEVCGDNDNDPCYFPDPGNAPQVLACDATVCGKVYAQSGPNKADVDVYKVTLVDTDGDGFVNFSYSFASAFRGFAALVPAAGCTPINQAIAHIDSIKCVEVQVEPMCLPAGSYHLIVAPGEWPVVSFMQVICGFDNAYTLTTNCSQQNCGPACDAKAGPCFYPHKSVGCDDIACCQATCVQDPSCCTLQWDQECANIAIALCAPIPVNDNCSGAVPLHEGSTDFATFGATDGSPVLPGFCFEGGPGGNKKDIWFRYKPAFDGIATITTCGHILTFDSAIAVYKGSCAALTLLTCDDNGAAPCLPPFASKVTFAVDCGVEYFVRVGGGWGEGTFDVSVLGGPPCPACPADLNGDNTVGPADLAILLGNWGTTGAGNLDGVGTVGPADLAILLGAWGPCP